MPIYEYECTKCGHHSEVWQKFSDSALTKCEMCKGRMKKLISQSAFHLKGTGWYVTDYASKGTSNKKAPSKGTDTATESKGSNEQPKKKEASPGPEGNSTNG